jgi:hypothetical protein
LDWRDGEQPGELGGILRLLELTDAHPSEVRADFRSKFGISFDEVGGTVSWSEAAHLIAVLMRDPSSWLQAAANGWKYPVSREWELLAHQIDLTMQMNSSKAKKPKPLERPWSKKNVERMGRPAQDPRKVLELLDRMNPKES